MCLIEMYNRVRVGKDLFDMFRIKKGLKRRGALSPLFFNFALDYAIRRVQVNQYDSINNSFWFMLLMLIQWEEA